MLSTIKERYVYWMTKALQIVDKANYFVSEV
jgi:hypothetical protein